MACSCLGTAPCPSLSLGWPRRPSNASQRYARACWEDDLAALRKTHLCVAAPLFEDSLSSDGQWRIILELASRNQQLHRGWYNQEGLAEFDWPEMCELKIKVRNHKNLNIRTCFAPYKICEHVTLPDETFCRIKCKKPRPCACDARRRPPRSLRLWPRQAVASLRR